MRQQDEYERQVRPQGQQSNQRPEQRGSSGRSDMHQDRGRSAYGGGQHQDAGRARAGGWSHGDADALDGDFGDEDFEQLRRSTRNPNPNAGDANRQPEEQSDSWRRQHDSRFGDWYAGEDSHQGHSNRQHRGESEDRAYGGSASHKPGEGDGGSHHHQPRHGGESRAVRGPHAGRGPKGYSRSDERIKEDVCERLMHDDQIDASEISVTVQDGVVHLSGSVEERWMKHQAEDIADSCTSVQDVRNELRVRHRQGTGSTQASNDSDATVNRSDGSGRTAAGQQSGERNSAQESARASS